MNDDRKMPMIIEANYYVVMDRTGFPRALFRYLSDADGWAKQKQTATNEQHTRLPYVDWKWMHDHHEEHCVQNDSCEVLSACTLCGRYAFECCIGAWDGKDVCQDCHARKRAEARFFREEVRDATHAE